VDWVGGDGCLRGLFFSLRFPDAFRVVKKNSSLLDYLMPFNQSPIVPLDNSTSTGMSLRILNLLILSAILRPVREQRPHSWAPGIGSSSRFLTAWKYMCITGLFNCTQRLSLVNLGYTNFLMGPFVQSRERPYVGA
jgi:hypothetical protein